MLRMWRNVRVAAQLRLYGKMSKGRVLPTMTSEDEKLIHRGDFYGVAPTGNRQPVNTVLPEAVLTRMYEQSRRNYRVNGETLMVDVLLRLERGDREVVSILERSGSRWIPLLFSLTGRTLSNLHTQSRRIIADRLWKQIEQRNLPVCISTYNAYLQSQIENKVDWKVCDALSTVEEKWKLVPDQDTFNILLHKLALERDVNGCTKMVYEMARRGLVVDRVSNSHLVYANAVRGFVHKADSLITQSRTKYGEEGEVLALGALAKAAAASGNIERLRKVFRRSVDDKLKLRLEKEDLFEVIWILSDKSQDGGKSRVVLIEEILSRAQRSTGFFRYMFRELECHIANDHFHTAISILEETRRVQDHLERQDRNLFAHQMVSRICRQMVRSKLDMQTMKELANRIESVLHSGGRQVFTELLLSCLTLKDSSPDERFESLSSLIPILDPLKQRPHLILPILAFSPSLDDRLKVLFRSHSLGYSQLSQLDTPCLVHHILLPLHTRGKHSKQSNPFVYMAEVLYSYGVTRQELWSALHSWWQMKKKEEMSTALEGRRAPHAIDIQGWLREEYSSAFMDKKIIEGNTSGRTVSVEKIQSLIHKGDSSSLTKLLSSNGWPTDADLSVLAPQILKLALLNETSSTVMKFLIDLSEESMRRCNEESASSPLHNFHLLQVLRHRVIEAKLELPGIIELCYELRRLFPNATSSYDTFFTAVSECSRLFVACFRLAKSQVLSLSTVDNIIDLLRTLIKLEMVSLHSAETLTPMFVTRVLERFGWSQSVQTWQRLQSSLSCSNGLIVLLIHALRNPSVDVTGVQYVLHKAQGSMSSSRIHSFYLAALIAHHDIEGAKAYLDNNSDEMNGFDCLQAYRLVLFLNQPKVDKQFLLQFPSIVMERIEIGEEESKGMLSTALRLCESKRLGPMIMEVSEDFARHGIEAEEEEKMRVQNTLDAHQRIVNRWVYAPQGLLALCQSDEAMSEGEWQSKVARV